MRKALLPGILVGGLLLAGPVTAQTGPTDMVVAVPEVEVRSGPSPQYYATGRLKQGDRVTVTGEAKAQPGWLAIKPPPGSFSWINARFVKQTGNHGGVVMGQEDVPVMPGSAVTNQPPNVEQIKVKPGFIVAILDKPMVAASGTWLPILPPPGEVRYLPASAVGGGTTTVVARPPLPGVVPVAASSNPLLVQADQAYLAGNLEQAKQLYKEAADKTTDHGQRIYCFNRLAVLQKGSWTPVINQVPSPGHPQNTNVARVSSPPAPVTPQPPRVAPAPPAQSTSLYASANQPATPPQWSAWGMLRRTAISPDNQPLYALEDRQGKFLTYVTTSPGVSLQPYLGQTICVYGTVHYRSDGYLRTNYMVASHVALP